MKSTPTIIKQIIKAIWPNAYITRYYFPVPGEGNRRLTLAEAEKEAGGKHELDILLRRYPDLITLQREKNGRPYFISWLQLQDAMTALQIDTQKQVEPKLRKAI